MVEQRSGLKLYLAKAISLLILVGFLTWQGAIAYFVHSVSSLLPDLRAPEHSTLFIVGMQPFMWMFMLLTVGLGIDFIRRRDFLVLNSILMVAIIAVATVFLHILALLAGYAPIIALGNSTHG